MSKIAKLPKLDVAALVGLQQASLQTVVEAQKVLGDAARSIAELGYGLVRETAQSTPTLLKLDLHKKPEAYLADAKAAAAKVAEVTRQSVEIGLKAQNDAAQLFAARAAANLDGLKALAA